MKYRLKSDFVEAVQWFKIGDHTEVITKYKIDYPEEKCKRCGLLRINHGVFHGVIVCPGDYIVTEENDIPRLWARDLFERKYEKVEE